MKTTSIKSYNNKQLPLDKDICEFLNEEICIYLPEAESKIWHAHPVWFLEGNPIVGYGKLKDCVRILFWSGQSFDVDGLGVTGAFQAAEKRFTSVNQMDKE